MSNHARLTLLIVLVVWLGAMSLIYVVMGEPAKSEGPTLSSMLFTQRQLDKAPLPPVDSPPLTPPASPEAATGATGAPGSTAAPGPGAREPYGDFDEGDNDELKGYSPCAAVKGNGTFKDLTGHYDAKGRYLVLLDLDGQVGEHKAKSDLHSTGGVTFVDFMGNVKFKNGSLKVTPTSGPGTVVRLGSHPGFTRISLNYRHQNRLKDVGVEVLCRPGGLAIRYSFAGPGFTPVDIKGRTLGKPAPLPPADAVLEEVYQEEEGQVQRDSAPVSSAPTNLTSPTNQTIPTNQTSQEPKSSSAPLPPPTPVKPLVSPVISDPLAPGDPQGPAADLNANLSSPEPLPLAGEAVSNATGLASQPAGENGQPEIRGDFTVPPTVAKSEGASKENLPRKDPVKAASGPKDDKAILGSPDQETSPGALNATEAPKDRPTVKDLLPKSVALPQGDNKELPANTRLEESLDLERDFVPVKSSGQGRGKLNYLSGKYDSQGRFILLLAVEGNIGEWRFSSQRDPDGQGGKGSKLIVTFLDFMGQFTYKDQYLRFPTGPARTFRFGQHPEYTRLSLNFRANNLPSAVKVKLLRRANVLAVVYEMSGVTPVIAPDEPIKLEPTAKEELEKSPEPKAKEEVEKAPEPKAKEEVEKAPEPTSTTDKAPAKEPAKAADKAPVKATDQAVDPQLTSEEALGQELEKEEGLKPPAPEGAESSSAASFPQIGKPGDVGHGKIGPVTAWYDKEGRFNLAADFDGEIGEYRLSLESAGEETTGYLEFVGSFEIRATSFDVPKGAVQKVTVKPGQDLTRISLLFRPELKPQKITGGLAVKDRRLAIAFKFQEEGPSSKTVTP